MDGQRCCFRPFHLVLAAHVLNASELPARMWPLCSPSPLQAGEIKRDYVVINRRQCRLVTGSEGGEPRWDQGLGNIATTMPKTTSSLGGATSCHHRTNGPSSVRRPEHDVVPSSHRSRPKRCLHRCHWVIQRDHGRLQICCRLKMPLQLC